MDVKTLKHETKKLPRIDKIAEQLDKHWLDPIKANSNPAFYFLQQLKPAQKQEINKQIRQLKNAMREIKYGQIVNEKLASAAHLLVDLKIAMVMKHYKKARHIVSILVHDRQSSLKRLLFEIPYLESQLSMFHTSYNNVVEQLGKHLPLEQNLTLLTGKQQRIMTHLMAVPKKQKVMIKHLGRHFVSIAKELKKKKEFKKLLK
jgi:hypothetical protein